MLYRVYTLLNTFDLRLRYYAIENMTYNHRAVENTICLPFFDTSNRKWKFIKKNYRSRVVISEYKFIPFPAVACEYSKFTLSTAHQQYCSIRSERFYRPST